MGMCRAGHRPKSGHGAVSRERAGSAIREFEAFGAAQRLSFQAEMPDMDVQRRCHLNSPLIDSANTVRSASRSRLGSDILTRAKGELITANWRRDPGRIPELWGGAVAGIRTGAEAAIDRDKNVTFMIIVSKFVCSLAFLAHNTCKKIHDSAKNQSTGIICDWG